MAKDSKPPQAPSEWGKKFGEYAKKAAEAKRQYDDFRAASKGDGASEAPAQQFGARDPLRLFNFLITNPDKLEKLSPTAGRLLASKDKGYSAAVAVALRSSNQSLDGYAEAMRTIVQSNRETKPWLATMKARGRTAPRDLTGDDVSELWSTLLPTANKADRDATLAAFMYKTYGAAPKPGASAPPAATGPAGAQRLPRRFGNARAELDDIGAQGDVDSYSALKDTMRRFCAKLPCTEGELYEYADMFAAIGDLDEQERKLLRRLR